MPGKLRKITSEEAREMQRIGAQKLKERNASSIASTEPRRPTQDA